MAFTEMERLFVEFLEEITPKLVRFSSNDDELRSVLNVVGCCLSGISDSSSKLTVKALRPLKKSLVAKDLLRHSNSEVKVSLASCICEITRLSGGEISDKDQDQRREIFGLMIDSMEGLWDTSSCSYFKRIFILVSMSKYPVLLMMEAHELIHEMFNHFLNSIRDYHPEHVFSAMETIMTSVLTRGGQVSSDLRFLLNGCINKEYDAIDKQLAQRLVPFLDDTDDDEANTRDTAEKIEPDNLESKMVVIPETEPGQAIKKTTGNPSGGQYVCATYANRDPLSMNPTFLQKKPKCSYHNTDEAKTRDTAEKIKPDNLESKMVVKPETEPGQAIKKTTGTHIEFIYDDNDNYIADASPSESGEGTHLRFREDV